MSVSILVCDDDLKIRELMKEYLEQHHFQVKTAENGEKMLGLLSEQSFDLILLDLMMPGEDGLSLCRKVRNESRIPIIMVTAVNDDIDRVAALEIGADYYMTKPVNMRVLMAYIKTILRRRLCDEKEASEKEAVEMDADTYIFESWQLSMNTRNLIAPSGASVTLTSGEFQILLALARSPRCVLSRDQLLDVAFHRGEEPFDRSIDVLISRLRRKIKAQTPETDFIRTIRNAGYLMDCDVK